MTTLHCAVLQQCGSSEVMIEFVKALVEMTEPKFLTADALHLPSKQGKASIWERQIIYGYTDICQGSFESCIFFACLHLRLARTCVLSRGCLCKNRRVRSCLRHRTPAEFQLSISELCISKTTPNSATQWSSSIIINHRLSSLESIFIIKHAPYPSSSINGSNSACQTSEETVKDQLIDAKDMIKVCFSAQNHDCNWSFRQLQISLKDSVHQGSPPQQFSSTCSALKHQKPNLAAFKSYCRSSIITEFAKFIKWASSNKYLKSSIQKCIDPNHQQRSFQLSSPINITNISTTSFTTQLCLWNAGSCRFIVTRWCTIWTWVFSSSLFTAFMASRMISTSIVYNIYILD